MLAPSAPQSFYLHEISPHRRLPPPWEVMSGKISVNTLAATQNIVFLACQLTSVRPSSRACSRTPSQITQRCWIQAKMVQIRVAFTPGRGPRGGGGKPNPEPRAISFGRYEKGTRTNESLRSNGTPIPRTRRNHKKLFLGIQNSPLCTPPAVG